MKKNGILVRKLAEMEETLRRLQGYLPSTYEEFAKDWGRQKIVERALQILVEAMIDIGERLLRSPGGFPLRLQLRSWSGLKGSGWFRMPVDTFR